MGHSINAIILKGEYDKEEAKKYDLIEVKLDFNLSMFFINGFYTACWQKKLNTNGFLETNFKGTTWYPKEKVIYKLMKQISKSKEVEFAIILTDYFGGVGQQYADVYKEEKNIDLEINTISKALRYLGVEKGNHHDEFDAVGLANYRSNPDYLDKYIEIADELGV